MPDKLKDQKRPCTLCNQKYTPVHSKQEFCSVPHKREFERRAYILGRAALGALLRIEHAC